MPFAHPQPQPLSLCPLVPKLTPSHKPSPTRLAVQLDSKFQRGTISVPLTGVRDSHGSMQEKLLVNHDREVDREWIRVGEIIPRALFTIIYLHIFV